MTSKFGAVECFVYMALPGTDVFVTAAGFVLDTDRAGVPRGAAQRISGAFVYPGFRLTHVIRWETR
jgi:hypothetical protein